jgi:signal transduction histidine kinase
MAQRGMRWLVGDRFRSPRFGVVVGAVSVAACTGLLYPLKTLAPVDSLGVVYILAVLAVALNWSLWLAVLTALVSAAAFDFFHIPPTPSLAISGSQNLAAFAAFVVAALIAVVVAYLTDRLRTGEELRRREAQARVRVLAAADEERRRVVRDLHDGAQQRLVHAVITLKLALRALKEGDAEDAEPLVSEALGHAEQATVEVRELAHGILPSVLASGGLRAGIESLVSRVSLPVEVSVPAARYSPSIEATAYFIVAEALTNVIKHAGATRAEVRVLDDRRVLRIEVSDDGAGGARMDVGSGLVGLEDRVSTLGGDLRIESPPGGGTLLAAALPLSERDLDG